MGIDIAADTFTAAWRTRAGKPTLPFTAEQPPAGFAALQRRRAAGGAASANVLVVMEATGNYRVALAVTPHEAGSRVAVVNPRQAHHFATARLRRAKTDARDARDRAQLAAALQPTPWTPPPAVYHEVRQRLVARDGLLAMRTQARNRRHAPQQWPVVVAGVRQHLDELMADLDRRIAALEAEIATVLKEGVWAESLACLTSAPGIGRVTAAWLLARTLNLALCTGPEALSADAGLAPLPRASGRSSRGRATIGHDGNGRLRTVLSMATRSAARCNPAIKAFYQRLRAAGKPLKVARCAAARTLLHQAWALGSKLQRFDPEHQHHHHDALLELAA